jgi:hypothetical protein
MGQFKERIGRVRRIDADLHRKFLLAEIARSGAPLSHLQPRTRKDARGKDIVGTAAQA